MRGDEGVAEGFAMGASRTPSSRPAGHLLPAGEKRERAALPGRSIDAYHFRDCLGGVASGEPLALRIMPGAEFETFTDESRQALFGREFTVSADNNRQGMRLEGPLLTLTTKLELLSHGIMPGTIQVPPSGQAVIQLADLWKLGQAPQGARMRFELISRDAAVAAIRDEELRLKRLANLLAGRTVRKAG